ncbi:MAG: hypothetical protein KDC35_06200 [Acidobacteria bacterium]|nr:hypothetical protein [Acidobacteriota bacterium]
MRNLLLCVWSTLALAQGGLRYSIQVIEFENKSGWHGQWELGHAWDALLTDSLTQSGKFIVVADPEMRAAAMDEQDFAASGRTAGGNKAPQTGQMTPSQLLVRGVIHQFDDGTSGGGAGASYKGIGIKVKGGTALISGVIYVVDSTTGTVTASHEFQQEMKLKGVGLSLSRHGFHGDVGGFKKTPAGEMMSKACDEATSFVVSQLDRIQWTGTVVKSGSKIIVNRGEREGVTKDMVFAVGESEEIRDPDTGELLYTDVTKSATIKVVDVKEKIAICELVSGEAPIEGQTIFSN